MASSSASSSSYAMSAESFLGSYISLTSKMEIRYEGELVALDPKEATIALKNVRSFGTEGRRKDGPQVLSDNHLYDYIQFRRSDIKDIKVLLLPESYPKPQIPKDPSNIQSNGNLSCSSSGTVALGCVPPIDPISTIVSSALPLPSNLDALNKSVVGPAAPDSAQGVWPGHYASLAHNQPTQIGITTSLDTQNQKYTFESKGKSALLLTPSDSLPSSKVQAPLLPLPQSVKQHSTMQFNEEFDFSAMNEKFNKDEIWGTLGKNEAKVGQVRGDSAARLNFVQKGLSDNCEEIVTKISYDKDDFFDTISCNSLGQGRSKFSERMKLDIQTFGDFPRNPSLGRGRRRGSAGWNRGS